MVKRRNPRVKEEEDEEENLPLLITTKVVEYLEPVMSEELLCKFPDNSALGFNYSQSSLWSPLVPRTICRPTTETEDSDTRRDLTRELGEFEEENSTQTKEKKKKKKKKKKMKFLGFDVSAVKKKKMAMRVNKMDSGFCANPLKVGCFGTMATKGWGNMLKAASKHFKKTTKKRDPIVKLSNYLKFPQI